MISIPRALIPGWVRGKRPGDMLLSEGSIFSPTTGVSLTRGGQRAYYSQGP